MQSNQSNFRLTMTLSVVVLTLIVASTQAAAQSESLLYSFTSNGGPQAGVVFDSAGNLYGSTPGSVYELTPQAGGAWTEKTLYTFPSGVDAEGTPSFDSAGNLWGGTFAFTGNAGTIFELTPSGGGSWTEQTVYTFPPTGVHGNAPYGGVIFDKSGNIYGTTFYGGAYGGSSDGIPGGTVFELVKQSGGGYTEKLLHSFGNGSDGYYPFAGLIFDSAGNLYGTSTRGGAYGDGTVFELIHQTNGQWKEKILHNFGSPAPYDGQLPYTSLIFDSAGNLYGTTTRGGTDGNGTAFELIPQTDGRWKEKILLNLEGSNGDYASSALVFDSTGNLYGATFFGGLYGGGVAYELLPRSDGYWSQSILHNFGNGTDGSGSLGSVTFNAGHLFGTTQSGGTGEFGTVWEIQP